MGVPDEKLEWSVRRAIRSTEDALETAASLAQENPVNVFWPLTITQLGNAREALRSVVSHWDGDE